MTNDDPNDDQKVVKVATIFECINCDYNTSRKSDYKKHLATDKHKMMTNDDPKISKLSKLSNDEKTFSCFCGKKYKYKQGLSIHRKKCDYTENNVLDNSSELICTSGNGKNDYKKMFFEIMNQNKILQNIIIEQNKNINEIIPKVGNNNNNTIKQKLNINILLNEKCKDAISMDEFIKNIEISMNNLLFTKEKGLVEGISNVFIENLNKIPTLQRPLWCSDKKKKRLFIKEENWSEDINNEKTKEAIKNIGSIQVKNVNKYIENKPNWLDSDTEKENYIKIVKKTTEPISSGNEEKIINNLINTIHLDETVL